MDPCSFLLPSSGLSHLWEGKIGSVTRGLFQSRWAPGFPGRWPCRKAKGREGSLSNPAGPGPGRDRAWVGSRHHPKALEPTLVRSRRSGSSGHLPRCLYSSQVRTQSTERKHCTNPAEWSARAVQGEPDGRPREGLIQGGRALCNGLSCFLARGLLGSDYHLRSARQDICSDPWAWAGPASRAPGLGGCPALALCFCPYPSALLSL